MQVFDSIKKSTYFIIRVFGVTANWCTATTILNEITTQLINSFVSHTQVVYFLSARWLPQSQLWATD